jgi:hypothetical protein
MNTHRGKRHMDLSNSWFQLVIGAVLGGAIGWGTAAYFAREAARDTQQQLALARQQLSIAVQQAQVSELQTRMMTTLLVTSEAQGQVKLARDAKGEITGFRVVEGRGAVHDSQDSVSASGHRGDPP